MIVRICKYSHTIAHTSIDSIDCRVYKALTIMKITSFTVYITKLIAPVLQETVAFQNGLF